MVYSLQNALFRLSRRAAFVAEFNSSLLSIARKILTKSSSIESGKRYLTRMNKRHEYMNIQTLLYILALRKSDVIQNKKRKKKITAHVCFCIFCLMFNWLLMFIINTRVIV